MLAGATIVFARSPVSLLVLAAVLVAGLALVVIRRQDTAVRRATQSVFLISAVVTAAIAWAFRGPIIGLVDAAADVAERSSIWSAVGDLVAQQPVLGWGWVGVWPTRVYPFSSVVSTSGAQPDAALNA